jgi:hypothetical protein
LDTFGHDDAFHDVSFPDPDQSGEEPSFFTGFAES